MLVKTKNPKHRHATKFTRAICGDECKYPKGKINDWWNWNNGPRLKNLTITSYEELHDKLAKSGIKLKIRGAVLFHKPDAKVLICDNPDNGCGAELFLLEDCPEGGYQIWRCPQGTPDYFIRYKPKRLKKKIQKKNPLLAVKVDCDANTTIGLEEEDTMV